jgi:hypothetical protein
VSQLAIQFDRTPSVVDPDSVILEIKTLEEKRELL